MTPCDVVDDLPDADAVAVADVVALALLALALDPSTAASTPFPHDFENSIYVPSCSHPNSDRIRRIGIDRSPLPTFRNYFVCTLLYR